MQFTKAQLNGYNVETEYWDSALGITGEITACQNWHEVKEAINIFIAAEQEISITITPRDKPIYAIHKSTTN